MRHKKLVLEILSVLVVLSISLLTGPASFCASFYVHEGGHIFFGTISNMLFYQTLYIPQITSWIGCPAMSMVPVPQQTTNAEGLGSALFTFGGVITVIFVTLVIFMYLSYKTKDKRIKIILYLVIIVFAIHEVVGNILLGTDNPLGKPLFPYIMNNDIIIFTLTGLFFLILLPYRKKFLVFYEKSKYQELSRVCV